MGKRILPMGVGSKRKRIFPVSVGDRMGYSTIHNL
jgi:hypothetical protein